jgi:hypothetical protein
MRWKQSMTPSRHDHTLYPAVFPLLLKPGNGAAMPSAESHDVYNHIMDRETSRQRRVRTILALAPALGISKRTAIERSWAKGVALVARNRVGGCLAVDSIFLHRLDFHGESQSGRVQRSGSTRQRAIVPARLVERCFCAKFWHFHFHLPSFKHYTHY